MNLKNRFLEIRLKRGYRFAKDFADFLEINSQQYSRYESNKSQPSLEVIYKAAKKLNMHIEDIIYEEEQ
nr:helix-turn-helix transcriptional regulator [Clostridium sporogenes]